MTVRDDASEAGGDIQRTDDSKDWLVIGWFTPDYRPLAVKLAGTLEAHGAPHHLFSKEKRHGVWDVRRKPSVIIEAMDAHPGKTLILMDVDCIVTGDLTPAARLTTDLAVSIKARPRKWQRGIVITLGSRVVVFRPTTQARSFVTDWVRLSEQAPVGASTEVGMAWAFVARPDVTYSHLDQRYAGLERDASHALDNVVVWHDSAHEKGQRTSLRNRIKSVERRWFRAGRTKSAMTKKIG